MEGPTKGVTKRAEAEEGLEEGPGGVDSELARAEKAIDAHPLTLRASLPQRRATPAQAVAAVMAAHANQHGAETPSRDPPRRACVHVRTHGARARACVRA